MTFCGLVRLQQCHAQTFAFQVITAVFHFAGLEIIFVPRVVLLPQASMDGSSSSRGPWLSQGLQLSALWQHLCG